MDSLTLTRSRRLRRALGFFALVSLLGATLEPAAHAVAEAEDPPLGVESDPFPWAQDSPSDSDGGEPEGVHEEFDCILCLAAGSPPLSASGGLAVTPDKSSGQAHGTRAPPLPADIPPEVQPRAPPLPSSV